MHRESGGCNQTSRQTKKKNGDRGERLMIRTVERKWCGERDRQTDRQTDR
jgi:hypothetical protein